ncbi:hypothetical protein [Paraburkholderia ultramafica]|uniref:hypothetical protein n=1 Tax=Paraburkholderia ultramafica TaxID=1544867 RepID=UPI0015822CE2|nr:hypothetical protein [Paraburkholderia ultramafica]
MLAVFVLAASSKAEVRTIQIVSGTYGQNCGAPHGNVTHDVAHQCDGRMTCEYAPRGTHKRRLAMACSSDFVAEWRCDSADFHTAALSPEARSGDTLVLSCVMERGAGK